MILKMVCVLLLQVSLTKTQMVSKFSTDDCVMFTKLPNFQLALNYFKTFINHLILRDTIKFYFSKSNDKSRYNEWIACTLEPSVTDGTTIITPTESIMGDYYLVIVYSKRTTFPFESITLILFNQNLDRLGQIKISVKTTSRTNDYMQIGDLFVLYLQLAQEDRIKKIEITKKSGPISPIYFTVYAATKKTAKKNLVNMVRKSTFFKAGSHKNKPSSQQLGRECPYVRGRNADRVEYKCFYATSQQINFFFNTTEFAQDYTQASPNSKLYTVSGIIIFEIFFVNSTLQFVLNMKQSVIRRSSRIAGMRQNAKSRHSLNINPGNELNAWGGAGGNEGMDYDGRGSSVTQGYSGSEASQDIIASEPWSE